jgi:hypothetical protein
MRSSQTQRVLALIPERRARAHLGSAFPPAGQSAQIEYLSKLLSWLSPLATLEQHDQAALGLQGLRNKMAEPDEEELSDGRKRRPGAPFFGERPNDPRGNDSSLSDPLADPAGDGYGDFQE